MHQFTDNEGRPWQLVLNGWQLKKLKETIDFDARDHKSILRACEDPALICDIAFVLCEEQAQKANVTDRQFGEALSGDAIDDATEALLAELTDFFPRSQRLALTKVLATVKEYQTRATTLATEKLESPAMTSLIEKSIAEASQKIDSLLAGTSIGNSSGKQPALPA